MVEDSMRYTEAGDGRSDPGSASRRQFMVQALIAAAMGPMPALIELTEAAQATGPELALDTFHGVAVFFVPGPDPYSVQQRESTPDEPGGLETGAGK